MTEATTADEIREVEGIDENAEDPIVAEWDGAYTFFALKIPGSHYTLFKNRIRIEAGWFRREISETQFSKIDRASIISSPLGRLFNVGDVILSTKLFKNQDPILHVKDPETVLATINQACYDDKQAYLERRKRENNYYHKRPKRPRT